MSPGAWWCLVSARCRRWPKIPARASGAAARSAVVAPAIGSDERGASGPRRARRARTRRLAGSGAGAGSAGAGAWGAWGARSTDRGVGLRWRWGEQQPQLWAADGWIFLGGRRRVGDDQSGAVELYRCRWADWQTPKEAGGGQTQSLRWREERGRRGDGGRQRDWGEETGTLGNQVAKPEEGAGRSHPDPLVRQDSGIRNSSSRRSGQPTLRRSDDGMAGERHDIREGANTRIKVLR